jgi:hypothetical protein
MRWARYSKRPIDPQDELPHLNGSLCLVDGPDWNSQRHAPEELKSPTPKTPARAPRSQQHGTPKDFGPLNPVIRRSPTPNPGILITNSHGETALRMPGRLLTSAERSAQLKNQLKTKSDD